MNARTAIAEGFSKNGGVSRTIAVHMDEATFFELRALAVEEGRTISNLCLRTLRKALDDRNMVAHAEKPAAHVSL
jgi:hypothetical protein